MWNSPSLIKNNKSQLGRRVPSNFGSVAAPRLGFHFSKCLIALLLGFMLSVALSAPLLAQTATPEMPPMPLDLEMRLKKLETELR